VASQFRKKLNNSCFNLSIPHPVVSLHHSSTLLRATCRTPCCLTPNKEFRKYDFGKFGTAFPLSVISNVTVLAKVRSPSHRNKRHIMHKAASAADLSQQSSGLTGRSFRWHIALAGWGARYSPPSKAWVSNLVPMKANTAHYHDALRHLADGFGRSNKEVPDHRPQPYLWWSSPWPAGNFESGSSRMESSLRLNFCFGTLTALIAHCVLVACPLRFHSHFYLRGVSCLLLSWLHFQSASIHCCNSAGFLRIADRLTWHIRPSLSIALAIQLVGLTPSWHPTQAVGFCSVGHRLTRDGIREATIPLVAKSRHYWRVCNRHSIAVLSRPPSRTTSRISCAKAPQTYRKHKKSLGK